MGCAAAEFDFGGLPSWLADPQARLGIWGGVSPNLTLCPTARPWPCAWLASGGCKEERVKSAPPGSARLDSMHHAVRVCDEMRELAKNTLLYLWRKSIGCWAGAACKVPTETRRPCAGRWRRRDAAAQLGPALPEPGGRLVAAAAAAHRAADPRARRARHPGAGEALACLAHSQGRSAWGLRHQVMVRAQARFSQAPLNLEAPGTAPAGLSGTPAVVDPCAISAR